MMLISQLSKITHVPVATIRFYERYGLISGGKEKHITTNNYTYYSQETVEKLELIMDAKEVGFTLAEIKDLLEAWYGNVFSGEEKAAIIQKKIDEVQLRIEQLTEMKETLREWQITAGRNEC